MITAPKQDMPNKFAGHFPLSHLHNDMKTIEVHLQTLGFIFVRFFFKNPASLFFFIFMSY